MKSFLSLMFLCLLPCSLFIGCSGHNQYTTPVGGVSVAEITEADVDIKELYERVPASAFPARLVIMRIQEPEYTWSEKDRGPYKIVPTRDLESYEDFQKIQELPMILEVATLSRLLVPRNAKTLKDLRLPAARLKADLLLLYSVDTTFYVDGTPLGPLSLVSLGFLPNKKAFVTSTVSGALIDVRTGYIYGTSESTEKEEQRATVWSTEEAIDSSRKKAEKRAFESFVTNFQSLWKSVVERYTTKEEK